MKKKKTLSKIIVLTLVVILLTGCQTTLTDKKKQAVKNPETGQALTKNILCQPTNEKTRELYEKNGVALKNLPDCKEFKINSGKYEGLWTSFFVKPLAFIILWLGKYLGSFAVSIIIITLLIRLLLFPLTKQMSAQAETMKKANPELERIKKKYENKKDQDSMMKQNQEMMMVYQKYHFNPLSSCLASFIQLPLLLAFLEAINRVPALFEERFLGLQLGTTPMVGFGTSSFYMYLILIVLVALSTVLIFKMNPSMGTDPTMKMMPIMMSVMIIVTGLFMPAALNIYWMVGNFFTILQNIIVKKGMQKKHGKA